MNANESVHARELDAPVSSKVAPRDGVVYARDVPGIGCFALRPLRLPDDAKVIQSWVRRDYARYWGMNGKSVAEVAAAYAEIARTADVYVGFCDGAPAFLLETYTPEGHEVAAHYDVEPGDRGMHVLVGAVDNPVRGFTWAVFSTVMSFLFDETGATRIVVEPDVRNRKIHVLNRRAGFRYRKIIQLGQKTAHLAFCTREDHARAALGPLRPEGWPEAHLRPDVWAAVTRAFLRKALAELAHERILAPELVSSSGASATYRLASDDGGMVYTFRARVLALEHWEIDAASIEKRRDGAPAPLDALAFLLELRTRLAVSPTVLPVYLEEISSTLFAAAYKHAHERAGSPDLVHADFQEIEGAMAEGHPCFLANSGRVGFDVEDYLAYAPEAAAPVKLVWLAGHVRNTEMTCARDLTYDRLIDEELGAETRAAFERRLDELGLSPHDYVFLPVHPWQWRSKLALVFSGDLATRELVYLGTSVDSYRAQQSIRTFFNVSRPERRYVKTALSILNMGFMRGLSPDYMRGTPPINDWVADLVDGDPDFARVGFSILREVAAVGYRNPRFESGTAKGSPYRKMLAALWRESPTPHVAPGQRLMTMAALVHRDSAGIALLPELIAASGVGIDAWLERYFDVYLTPLVHFLYRYDMAFMPHGENVILVLEDDVPVRAIMKDIGEEVAVMDPTRALPKDVQRIAVAVPDELKVLAIFTDVFDGFLRFVAAILVTERGYPEARFWELVASCIRAYAERHPEHRAAMQRLDLFASELPHSCLNRLQLADNVQMIDLSNPATNLRFAGALRNPIAAHTPFANPST